MSAQGPSFVERLVGAEVRAAERMATFLLFLDLFVLLTAYYMLKVAREPLILVEGGAISRSYARGAQALLLLGVIPLYGIVANRVEPSRLVGWITAFFAGCLLVFPILSRLDVPLGFVFFVWLGIFSTMAIAQFWSLANDLFTEEEGKRLFPIVAAGGTIGAIVGSQIAAQSMRALGPFGLMWAAALLLGGCLELTRGARLQAAMLRRRVVADAAPPPAAPADARGGFALVLSDPYLLLIGLAVLALNLINTTGDFILAKLVNEYAAAAAAGAADPTAARQETIGAFYGNFQTWVSVLTAVIQILVVGRVFKVVGVRGALFILPLFALSGYGLFSVLPVLALLAVVKVVENSTDYSLQNTLQQALFLPTSRDAKYKAKVATDTFLVRMGDLASTGVVFVGVQVGLGLQGFSLVNVVASAVWLAFALALARRLGRRPPIRFDLQRRSLEPSVVPR